MHVPVYRKLVRDRIPAIIEASGKTCQVEVLAPAEYRQALNEKLGEELAEYLASGDVAELADQIAALGGLLRTQMGDPSGPASLAMNMAGFLENRALGLQAAQMLPANVRNHPAVATVMQLTDVSNQQIASYAPALAPLMQVLPSVTPGPMLVSPNP